MLLRVAKNSGGSLHGRVEIGRRTDADPASTLNPPSPRTSKRDRGGRDAGRSRRVKRALTAISAFTLMAIVFGIILSVNGLPKM
jgi:hypothetical protein